MSGRKCSNITISQAAYNKMLSRTKRADDAAAAARKRLDAERAGFEHVRLDIQNRQSEMTREFRKGLDGLSTALRASEIRQSERIDALRADVTQDLEAQRQEFRAALTAHREETSAALKSIRSEIADDKAAQQRYAAEQIADLEKLTDLMRRGKAHHGFAPGQLETIEERLSMARANFEAGQYQAALAAAQERYFEYQDLQITIAERQAEWDAYLSALHNRAAEVSGAIEAAEGASYQFDDAETPVATTETAADVDFWSEGAFSLIAGRMAEITSRLKEPDTLATDDLRAMLAALDPLDQELSEVVDKAKEALVQSQIRQNIAESVLASFEGTHWDLDDSTYESQDFRRAVHLKLVNPLREEIVISVRPVDHGNGLDAEVEINFFDKINDESMRADRLASIHEELRANDVNVDAFQCLDGSKNQPGAAEMRDFGRLRAEESSERVHDGQ